MERDQELLRTRRRWGSAAFLSLLLLVPAATIVGLARVQQTRGWADLPASVVTRLVWLEDSKLDEDLRRRLGEGDLRLSEISRIARGARDRLRESDSGPADLELLRACGWPSARVRLDDGSKARVLLIELDAPGLVDVLLARPTDPAVADRMLFESLAQLEDLDRRVTMRLLDEPEYLDRQFERRDGVRLSPIGWVAFRAVETAMSSIGLLPKMKQRIWASMLDQLRGFGSDHVEAAAWCKQIATDAQMRQKLLGVESAEQPVRIADPRFTFLSADDFARLLGVWMWTRLGDFPPGAEQTLLSLADDAPDLQALGAELLGGYPWSESTESYLTACISAGPTVQRAAISSATRFGEAANVLSPAMLEAIGDPDVPIGSSGFYRDYLALGGDEKDFVDAMSNRLRSYVQGLESGLYAPDPMVFFLGGRLDTEMLLILDLHDSYDGLRSAIEPLFGLDSHRGSFFAAAALVAQGGDAERATRWILDQNPSLDQPLSLGTPQHALIDLVRRDLADHDLVRLRLTIENASLDTRAFIAHLRNFLADTAILRHYEPIISAQADAGDLNAIELRDRLNEAN
ncbi:MAG: hypothetical protein CMJ31_05145 [Phycisphaerae bacterium]|nr:hypothetical protein [Phycisphaerae bacterium]